MRFENCLVHSPVTSVCDAQLLNVWVEPLVHVNVKLVEGSTAADSAVIIEATNWSLHGSELIESLGLNRRFSLAFQVSPLSTSRLMHLTICIQQAYKSSYNTFDPCALVSAGPPHMDPRRSSKGTRYQQWQRQRTKLATRPRCRHDANQI